MNHLRRLVLPAMVAGAALMAWSSTASAGEYLMRARPGNHQSNVVHTANTPIATRAVNSSVSSLAPMARAHAASASGTTSAAHASVRVGNTHNFVLPR